MTRIDKAEVALKDLLTLASEKNTRQRAEYGEQTDSHLDCIFIMGHITNDVPEDQPQEGVHIGFVDGRIEDIAKSIAIQMEEKDDMAAMVLQAVRIYLHEHSGFDFDAMLKKEHNKKVKEVLKGR